MLLILGGRPISFPCLITPHQTLVVMLGQLCWPPSNLVSVAFAFSTPLSGLMEAQGTFLYLSVWSHSFRALLHSRKSSQHFQHGCLLILPFALVILTTMLSRWIPFFFYSLDLSSETTACNQVLIFPWIVSQVFKLNMSANDILPHKPACGPVIFISGNASTIHPICQARNLEAGDDCFSLSLISHTQSIIWSLGICSQLLLHLSTSLQLSDHGELLTQFTLL